MRNFLQKRIEAFGYAFQGWGYVLRTQRNAWIHALASVAVFILAAWLRLTRIEWAILVLCVALVWGAEMINTALETIVDLASPAQHPLAKIGKDVGAAAVLVSAFTSVVIGLLILGPPLLARLNLSF